MSNTIAPARLQATCEDNITRRFHRSFTHMPLSSIMSGYVMHDNMMVKGTAIREPGSIDYVFRVTDDVNPFKRSYNGRVKVNCSSPKHCEKCQRCVGGCR